MSKPTRAFSKFSRASKQGREDRKSVDGIDIPTIYDSFKEKRRSEWMDDVETGSISSEDSSAFATCPQHKSVTYQQPWTREEINLALCSLPAGDVTLTLFTDVLSGVLLQALKSITQENTKTGTLKFGNGNVRKISLANESDTVIEATIVQLVTEWPDTCLLVACWLGKYELVKFLLDRGVSISIRDKDGRTPMHLAACSASSFVLEELIKRGAKISEWDYGQNYTPLHCAAAVGNTACVRLLIKSGADVNAGLTKRSPLHYAVLNNAVDCIEILLEAGACPNNPQVYTETPLHVAASLGYGACTKLLLKYGADVRVQLGSGRLTPLHLAAEEGSSECTRLLLEAGAKPDTRNSRGQTALHLAALSQSAESLDYLIKKRALVNVEDNDGRTPLHAAVAKALRCSESVKILIQAGAAINKPDKFGYTPLHIAALNESSQTVIMLLTKGADVTAKTRGGVSALSFIVRRTPDVLPLFIARLDQAVSLHDHELGDVDCELRLDFRSVVPSGKRETDLMLCLVEVGQRHILKHPLCESFLYLKWLKIRKFFLISLAYHALFVAFFTGYVAVTHLWHFDGFSKTFFWPTLVFTFILACKEIFQVAHGVSCYIKKWENWLQWSAVLVITAVLANTNENWQHHTAALGILLIWVELMIVVGRFPMFGLYIQMFTQVSINFFKFLGAYVCLIIGFALAFTVLHQNYKSFTNPFVGLLKTIIMMSGELEFEDVFFDEEAPIMYPGTSHLVLLTFVILVTIILTNLMVGLAVSDIQELRRCAGLDRLVRRAELISYLENMLFSRLLDYAPKRLIEACRGGARLLRPPHHCAIHVRPNDPRENRLPRDLIKSIYRLVSEKKNRCKSVSKTFYQNANAIERDIVNINRLYSSASGNDNQDQLYEITTELKRHSYSIRTCLDSLMHFVDTVSRDMDH